MYRLAGLDEDRYEVGFGCMDWIGEESVEKV
jgi:hypothetical protein